MKAIILAAGEGKRLRSIGLNIPKPMVRVYGKPILEHNIEWLKMNNITDIHINLHCFPEVITNYFQDGSSRGVNITYHKESELLGTSGAVKVISENWLESFLVICGDNFYPHSYDLVEFIGYHKREGGIATIGLYENAGVCKSGIVLLEGKRVIKFIEKPSIVNAGVYIFNYNIHVHIPIGFSDFGGDIFPRLVKYGKVNGFVFSGQITTIDTPEMLRKAQNDYHKNTI